MIPTLYPGLFMCASQAQIRSQTDLLVQSSAHLSYDRSLHISSVGVSDSFTNHNYRVFVSESLVHYSWGYSSNMTNAIITREESLLTLAGQPEHFRS